MKVLVTGGAGFVGSHTVELLLERGVSVVVYDNLSTGRRSYLPANHPGLTFIEADIRDAVRLAEACRGITHVLHLAAQVSVQASLEQPAESASVNVLGFVNVLEAARHAGVKRVVYASSAAVYGDPQTLPLTEASPLDPISPYGLEKQIDEQYARLYAQRYGISTLGLRYFNIYGPRQDPASPYAGVISRFCANLLADKPLHIFGSGEQTRDFIYVQDVAKINLRALAEDNEGVCNVGTGQSVSLKRLVGAMERVCERRAAVRFDAPMPGDIVDSSMAPYRLHEWWGNEHATQLEHGLASLVESLQ